MQSIRLYITMVNDITVVMALYPVLRPLPSDSRRRSSSESKGQLVLSSLNEVVASALQQEMLPHWIESATGNASEGNLSVDVTVVIVMHSWCEPKG